MPLACAAPIAALACSPTDPKPRAATTSGGASAAAGGPVTGGATSTGGGPAAGGSAGGIASGGVTTGNAGTGGANGGSASAGTSGSTTGGGTSGGASGLGCAAQSGLLFCEDFEQFAANAAPSGASWTTSYIGPDAPRIVVDASTPAHSGTHSASISAPLTNFQSFLVYHDAAVLPRAQGSFYLRAYLRLSREMADEHNVYLILDRAATPGGGAAVRLGEQARMLSLTVGGDSHGSLSNARFSQNQILGAHLTANTWGCIEGYFNSAPPEIDIWLDGVEIPDFHHTDWPADSYDTLRFGFEKYGGPELQIWIDDVAISTTRIGCR